MKIYNVLIESLYYDGDDFVLADTNTEVYSFSTQEKAISFLDGARNEVLEENPSITNVYQDGADYVALYEEFDGCERIAYKITIYEVELDSDDPS